MAPLPRPRGRRWRGLDVKPVLALLFMLSLGVLVMVLALEPLREQLNEARDTLCGGHLDFSRELKQPSLGQGSSGRTSALVWPRDGPLLADS